MQVGQALAEIATGATPEQRTTSNEEPAASAATAAPATAPADAASDGDAKASPIARRIAASKGVDLGSVSGSGPGGKVVKDDVLAAAGNGASAPAAVAPGEAKPLRGPAAMLAKAMDESRSVPTATSFRTLPVDTLDAKRKAINGALKDRGMKVSFTHLVAWAIVRAGVEWPVMGRSFSEIDGKPHVIENPSVNLGIAVDVERKGGRSLMVPCIKGAEGLDFASFHCLLRGPDHQDAREQAHRRRLPGHQHLAHQPGRARHRRLGPEAARRAGHDHRHRLDRLSGPNGPTRRPRRSRRSGCRR